MYVAAGSMWHSTLALLEAIIMCTADKAAAGAMPSSTLQISSIHVDKGQETRNSGRVKGAGAMGQEMAHMG